MNAALTKTPFAVALDLAVIPFGIVNLVYAAHDIDLPLAGFTAEEVQAALRDVLNVCPDIDAYLDGRLVPAAYRLRPGDRLEFVAAWGRKGADEAGTPTAQAVYYGSNAGATRSYLSKLEKKPYGRIAAQLFRTQKASSRAKLYRGGITRASGYRVSYRDLAYERKGEAIVQLCLLLQADSCGLTWGWAVDASQPYAKHVLYIDIPQGQVSFHSPERYVGPDYNGLWDGQHESETRIIAFCDAVGT